MTVVTTQPEVLLAAADQLQGIGSQLSAQNVAAAAPTTAVVPAAADAVSALAAAQFVSQAGVYQAISTHAAAIRDLVVCVLGAGAGSYASTEAANAASVS